MSTDKPKTGRGGFRPGAGRPPGSVRGSKPRETRTKKPKPKVESAAPPAPPLPTPRDVADLARKHSQEAVAALVDVATGAKDHPMARIAAAEKILLWGHGRPTGIGTPPKRPADAPLEAKAPIAAKAPPPPPGKKAQLRLAAENPNPGSNMGAALARRMQKDQA